jgi:hypothetical protein
MSWSWLLGAEVIGWEEWWEWHESVGSAEEDVGGSRGSESRTRCVGLEMMERQLNLRTHGQFNTSSSNSIDVSIKGVPISQHPWPILQRPGLHITMAQFGHNMSSLASASIPIWLSGLPLREIRDLQEACWVKLLVFCIDKSSCFVIHARTEAGKRPSTVLVHKGRAPHQTRAKYEKT